MGDVDNAAEAFWVFGGTKLEERYDTFKQRAREKEERQKREEEEAIEYMPFERVAPKKEPAQGRKASINMPCYNRPIKSVSMVGAALDIRLGQQSKKNLPWHNPKNIPTTEELQRRREERFAKVRFASFKTTPLKNASDWKTPGGRWKSPPQPLPSRPSKGKAAVPEKKDGSAASSIPQAKQRLTRNAQFRVQAKIEEMKKAR